jgi:AcrR family transcriptional regulator
MTERRTNEERSRQMRALLVGVARQLFETKGYAATSIEEVVREAGVTRGALYHHFPTKLALFDAVIVDIQSELADLVDRAGLAAKDPWDRFIAGWLAFIEVAPEAGIRRLMLEAPTVLGQQRWQEIDDEHALGIVAHGLEWLDERGQLGIEPSPMLAQVLLTVSNALGTLVAQADDPAAARREVAPIWERLLRSLAPDDPVPEET